MPEIKLGELLVIVVFLFVIFGPNRLSDLGGALGRSIRSFRNEVKADDADGTRRTDNGTVPAVAPLDEVSPRCARCSGPIGASDKFCMNCGAAVAPAAT
jgi:sec-independent protein translocase protein TatA